MMVMKSNMSNGHGQQVRTADTDRGKSSVPEAMAAVAGREERMNEGRLGGSKAGVQRGGTEEAGAMETVVETRMAMTVADGGEERGIMSRSLEKAGTEEHAADKSLVCHVEIQGNDKITMMDMLSAVKVTCGRIVGCRCKGPDKYELTMGNVRGKERLLDGFRIKNSRVMASEVAKDQRIVSFLNLPVYITDGEILNKLKLWGVEATSQIKRRKWAGTEIFDGTRFVRVRFTDTVSSLPYSTKFDTLEGTEFFRVIHDNQVKVCRLCVQPGHILRDCPDFVCFKCNKAGHYARECQEEIDRCDDCQKRKGNCTCGMYGANTAVSPAEEEEVEEEARGGDAEEDMDGGDLSWSDVPDYSGGAEPSQARDRSEGPTDSARESLGQSGGLTESPSQRPAAETGRRGGGEPESPEGGEGESSGQPGVQRSGRGLGRDPGQGREKRLSLSPGQNRDRSRSSCRAGCVSTQDSLPCGQREVANGEAAVHDSSTGTEKKANNGVSNESTDDDFERVVRGKFVRLRGNRSRKSGKKTLR